MAKLFRVALPVRMRPEAYDQFQRGIAGSLRRLAAPLRGKRIMHVNATEKGGGVAELLRSEVPLERALGFDSRWYVISGENGFFKITKEMHNLLQGKNGRLGEKEKMLYVRANREFGDEFACICASWRPDIVVLHDPQPLAMIACTPPEIPVIARLHIDLLTPNPQTLEFLRPYIMQARRVVVSSAEYLSGMPWLPRNRASVIYPAIDPLSEKNKTISHEAARQALADFSINFTKPIVAQVSRFDPWKDPLGVLRAYYLAKNKIPDLQLILAGLFLAKDDPESIEVFKTVIKHAKGDPDIFFFANPDRLRHLTNDLFVNSIYTVSTVMLQKSIREGFGLTMTEAMWKGKALVAGTTTGAKAQIKSGKNGILVSSSEEAAAAIVALVKDERLRNRLGRAARESVRRKFLMPRFVADNLKIYAGLLASSARVGLLPRRAKRVAIE